MMGCWMVFGPVVGVIEASWTPIDAKLFQCFSVTEPVEPHIHCFGAFWLNLAVDDAFGGRIVDLDWRGWLWMTELFEDESDIDGFSSVDVESGELSFGCGGHNILDDLGDI